MEQGINGFRQALLKYWPKGIVGYSVKTNWLPYAVAMAGKLGCYAEVVSHDEYQLARSCGFIPGRIIYNGPAKSRETFLEALRQGAIVNIETWREIEWLGALPRDGRFKVGLRVTVDISKVSPADAKHDDAMSRFGFSDASGELGRAIDAVKAFASVRLAGLHFHRTSLTRSVDFYRNLSRYAASIISKHGLAPEYVDMGGGYYGIFRNAPSFDEYCKAIFEELSPVVDPETTSLIIEPGNALTAAAFTLVTHVIDVKKQPDAVVVTTDGSRTLVDPLFKKNAYLDEEIRLPGQGRPILPVQEITGATCLEFDRLFALRDQPALLPGDFIVYHNVGAYTMCLSPLFINMPPEVLLMRRDSTFTTIRQRWSAAEWTAKSKLPK